MDILKLLFTQLLLHLTLLSAFSLQKFCSILIVNIFDLDFGYFLIFHFNPVVCRFCGEYWQYGIVQNGLYSMKLLSEVVKYFDLLFVVC